MRHGIQTTSTCSFVSLLLSFPCQTRYQVRLVLETPLVVPEPGNTLRGELCLTAHDRQSYDIDLELSVVSSADGVTPIATSRGKYDLKEPYYRQMQTWAPLLQQQHTVTG